MLYSTWLEGQINCCDSWEGIADITKATEIDLEAALPIGGDGKETSFAIQCI